MTVDANVFGFNKESLDSMFSKKFFFSNGPSLPEMVTADRSTNNSRCEVKEKVY